MSLLDTLNLPNWRLILFDTDGMHYTDPPLGVTIVRRECWFLRGARYVYDTGVGTPTLLDDDDQPVTLADLGALVLLHLRQGGSRDAVHPAVLAWVDEARERPRSYVPQEKAAAMLAALDAAKVATDKGNTLWALVHRVIEERDEARLVVETARPPPTFLVVPTGLGPNDRLLLAVAQVKCASPVQPPAWVEPSWATYGKPFEVNGVTYDYQGKVWWARWSGGKQPVDRDVVVAAFADWLAQNAARLQEEHARANPPMTRVFLLDGSTHLVYLPQETVERALSAVVVEVPHGG